MLEKIKKILAKAQGTNNEEEAKVFFMKAQEMMAKAGITVEDLEGVEVNKGREVDKDTVMTGKKTTANRNLSLAMVIARNFKVEAILRNGSSIVFIGFKEDVAIAKETFLAISSYMEKRRSKVYREYRKEGKDTKGIREQYTRGFISGLELSFQKNVEEKGLIVVKPKEVDEYIQKNVNLNGSRGVSTTGSGDMYNRGYDDGKGYGREIE